MSRFGELYPGVDREIAEQTRPVIDEEAVAAENAAYAAGQRAVAARIEADAAKSKGHFTEMDEAVRTINYVLGVLRSEGLEISTAYELSIRNLRSKGGDFVSCACAGPEGKLLAAQAVAIYRDSADTDQMGDKVADIFGLLE